MGVWGFSSRGKCGFGVLVRLLRDIGVIMVGKLFR